MNIIYVNKYYTKEKVTSLSDIIVFFTERPIDEVSFEYKEKDLDAVSFLNYLKENKDNLIAGNFYINNSGHISKYKGNFPMEKVSDDMFRDINGAFNIKKDVSVINLFGYLSDNNMVIDFKKEYYTNTTGGMTFDTFIPILDNTKIKASSLIISSGKFNIVLSTSISGLINTQFGETEIYRFYPFKFVKQGELVYNEIELENLTPITSNEITKYYELNNKTISLTDTPIFSNYEVGINELYYILNNINKNKSKLKGLHYIYKRVKLESNSEKVQWVRGEPVDEAYISDEGSDFLSCWIKGSKSSKSVDKLLNELGEFGSNVMSAVELTLSGIDSEDIKDELLSMLTELIISLYEGGTLNNNEKLTILSIVECLKLYDNNRNNLISIYNEIENVSKVINILELKLLNLRMCLLNNMQSEKLSTDRYIDQLGMNPKYVQDTVEFKVPMAKNEIIVIKKGKVISKPNATNFDIDNVKKIINEGIEGI